MNLRNRKLRLAILLGLAVFAGFYAWRTSQKIEQGECTPSREEVKDAAGKVVEIKSRICA